MNFTPYLRFALHLSLLAAFFALPATATVVSYTNAAAFEAAAGPQNSFGFDSAYNATPPATADYTTADGLTVNEVKFVGTLENASDYYYLFVSLPGADGHNVLFGSFTSFTAGAVNPYEYVGDTTLTFPFPVDSVSFLGVLDYGDAGSATFKIAFSNGDTFDGNRPWTFGDAYQFYGFTTSTPFTSLTITPGAPPANFTDPIFADVSTLYYLPAIESMSYQSAAPEPQLFAPCAILLLAAWSVRRAK